MREGAKKRLAGAMVMVALVVSFVPMLFEDESLAPPYVQGPLPPEPGFQDPFTFDAARTATETLPIPTDASGLTDEEARLTPPEPMQGFEAVDAVSFEDGSDEFTFEPIQEPASLTVTPPREARSAPPPAPRTQAQAPKPAQSPKTAQQPAQTPTSKPAVSLPEPPKSRADGLSSWVVQVSSLGSPEAAGKLADKLKQAGFSAFVERAEVSGKTYYRVRVGPDIDRANAERTADMLRKQQKLDTLIQRYQ
jgi:DedD protein